MNRRLYITLIAAISLLAACTEQHIDPAPQVPDSSHSYIFFEQEVVESIESKATLVEGTSLPAKSGSAFGVLGYAGTNTASIFAGENGIASVSWEDEIFKYDNLAIWHGNETEHHFYAYYPYDLGTVGVVTPNNADPYILFTQPTQESDMKDILTAHTSRKKASGNAVLLEFYHRLWALDIKIKNSQTTGVDGEGNTIASPSMKVTGIDVIVQNFPTKAYIYLNPNKGVELFKNESGNVVLNSSTCTYSFPVTDDESNIIAGGADKTYSSLLFSPVSTGLFKYKLEVTYLDATGKTAKFTTEFKTSTIAFESGKRYLLTINKTDDRFVVGEYYDPDGNATDFAPGDWRHSRVDHEFN